MAEVIVRHVPGHYWVRLFVSPRVEPGHRWMYRGIIRRDAWRIGPVGFGIMRLPKTEKHWAVDTANCDKRPPERSGPDRV